MHIVFFNVLGSGHVNPTLPIVRALVERGDTVTYFTYPERREDVQAAGATFENYGRDDFRVGLYNPQGDFPTQIYPAAVGLMPYLLERMRSLKPDRIVADSCAPWGAAVARVLDLPLIGSVSTFALSAKDTVELRRSAKMEMDAASCDALATLRDKWQVSFEESDFPSFYADENLVYTGQRLNPAISERTEKFKFVGPMTETRHDSSDFPIQHYASSKKKRVYISMGSILGRMHGLGQSFYQPFFDAIGGQEDYDVVVSIGKSVDPTSIDAPANVRIESFVPQLELLPHIDLFITHGGMNSVNEALYYGIPLIVLPYSGDQSFVAQRVQDVGAGIIMDHSTLESGALRDNIEHLLDDARYRQAAEVIQGDLRSASGIQGALELL